VKEEGGGGGGEEEEREEAVAALDWITTLLPLKLLLAAVV
jgi:hypothetical protein